VIERRTVVALAACAAVLAPAAAARAGDVAGERYQQLAHDAQRSPEALAALRQVTSVDGVPADLAQALAGASGADLRGRLQAIAPHGEPLELGEIDPRGDAREILAEDRFQPAQTPHPLRGALRWIGRQLEPLGAPVRAAARVVPGGSSVVWTVVGIAVTLTAAVVSVRTVRRRSLASGERAAAMRAAGADPAALERQAAEAEATGDFERAVRLRFGAGLIRLERAGLVEGAASRTSGELRRALASQSFASLAADHDAVAYGGRRADARDAERSRAAWARVAVEARR
jgi:hypothetical protein